MYQLNLTEQTLPLAKMCASILRKLKPDEAGSFSRQLDLLPPHGGAVTMSDEAAFVMATALDDLASVPMPGIAELRAALPAAGQLEAIQTQANLERLRKTPVGRMVKAAARALAPLLYALGWRPK